jgi:hypothetical protein
MSTQHKDENAKNPAFKVPVDLPHVKPEDYSASIDSSRGSAKGQTVTPEQPENPAKEKQKKSGALPRHEEPIGGG